MLKEHFLQEIEKKFKEYWYYPLFSDYKQGIENTLTYREVAETILKFHRFFHQIGIKKTDKITIIGRNSVNWGTIFLSVSTYCTAVPVLPDFKEEDIENILNHSDAKILFIAEEIYETIEVNSKKIEIIISLNDIKKVLYSKKEKAKEYYIKEINERITIEKEDFTIKKDINKDDIMLIMYTSGTTGHTKGVMLTYNNIWANIKFGIDNIDLRPGDKVLSFLPVAHTYALSFDMLTELFKGVHIVFLPVIPSPSILLKALKEIKPRLINTVPLLIEKIYKKIILKKINKMPIKYLLRTPLSKVILSKIREKLVEAFGSNFIQIIIGAAPLNTEIDNFLKKINLPYTAGYGMTECGPLISYIDYKNYKVGSVGKKINYLDLKIDSSDPYNEPGEILVKGENVMVGYYKNKEETEKTLKDGWLHTGDVGVIDKDGYLYIKGRIKSLILGPSGKNIYPEAIESKLNNMDFILESLVLEREGKLVALIYPDYEAVGSLNINESEVDNFLIKIMEKNRVLVNKQLPSYSQISKIEIVKEPFEKTPTKKIKRFLYK